MIPQYQETIAMIERDFPEMGWLLRNNHDKRGKYFFHLHGQEFREGKYQPSFTAWGSSPDSVAWQAYSDAKAVSR